MNTSKENKVAPKEKILIVSQYFSPDMASTGQVMAELAEDLASYGKEVRVIAGRTRYHNELPYAKYDNQIKRVGPGNLNKDNAWGRISSYLLFTTAAMSQFRLFLWADKIVMVSNPPTLTGLCAFVSVIFRKPVYFMVQDLYPDLAIHLGYVSPCSLMARGMYLLNRMGFSRAKKIVLISEAMREHFCQDPHYRKWADKAVVISNWEDPTEVFPAAKDNDWSRSNGYDKKFVVLYSGNIGLIQDFDPVMEASEILEDSKIDDAKDMVFIFAGEGGRKKYLVEKAKEKGLNNVSFIGYVPAESYNDLLATADCCIVALKPGMDSFGFPVKTYSYMAAGRPIIAVTDEGSELYALVKDSGMGLSATEGKSLAGVILKLKKDHGLAEGLGKRGQSVLRERFSRKISTKKYCDLISGSL